ncbi:MAG: hypothetical protein J6M21_06780 [Campylobacter sp.]|nr:hypothetical protein [Campylobacter sp.]
MSVQETPICPQCHTKDYVVLVNTGEKVGTIGGAVVGAAAGTGGAATGGQ